MLVPGEQPLALASVIGEFLQHKRRTHRPTRYTIEREFRPKAVGAQYREIYNEVRQQS
jgi:hypothetical protein